MNDTELSKNYEDRPCVSSLFDSSHLLVHSEFSQSFIKNNADDIAMSIVDKINESKPSTIVFINRGDGFCFELLEKINSIVKIILDQTYIILPNIIVVTGSKNSKKNVELYHEHCARYNWIPLRLGFINGWENSSAGSINSSLNNEYELFDITPRIKPKKFLCFNRRGAVHRWYMVAQFIKRNLLDNSFTSLYSVADSVNLDHAVLPNYQESEDIVRNNKDLFPLKLSLTTTFIDNEQNVYHPLSDIDYFNNSYFSIINESKFFKEIHRGCGHLDSFFLTEKTYKVISAKHPFILAHRPGVLNELRLDGYRTFHPFINESYDTVIDDQERLDAILDEVERLCSFTDEQWMEFQKGVADILLHNFNVLKTKTLDLVIES
jgi:hypothetical protein